MADINGAHVLLCARDETVIEAVEVTAAAMEVPLRVVRDSAEVRTAWPGAALRLVSTEVAARWTAVAPGRAHLVGASPAELARCSSELGLPVLPLPDVGGRLAETMAQALREEARRGAVIGLLGASGGLGVTTLAAALALAAARKGERAVGVDLARCGGGMDLLVGAEAAPGVRWAELAGARGELADVAVSLPAVDGARFLAQSREADATVGEPAVAAVVGSLARTSGLVVLDAGCEPPPVECDQVVLVVGADVRSVAAARMVAREAGATPSGLVVRTGPGRALPSEVVARSLGAPCLGVVGHHPALARLSEMGLPPTGGPARRYRRQVDALLERLSHG